ncbi:hypothetical protein [Vibrio vulnificus]|uniref:hypothetical protein n=1 Tax=Vibrio vulnificus TaxID=672 RepID=UPI00307F135B
MRKTLLTLAICASLSTRVMASGFPTFDAANLLQSVMEYSLILKEYEQILNQTGINTNELLTAIKQYEQTLREYQVLLNQVRALEHKIDRRDYTGVVRDVRRFSDQYLGSAEAPNTPAVSQRYGSVTSKETLTRLADSALGYTPDNLSHAYTLANDGNILEQKRQLYESRNAQSRQDIDHLDRQRNQLGDQSELATLQLIVEQNQVLIEQIATLNEVQLSNMTHSHQLAQQSAQAQYSASIERLKRIEWENKNPIVIDERPLR